MRRLRRLVAPLFAVGPPLLGTLVVVLLFAGLFALDLLVGADLRVFGVSDQATQQMVFQRYGSLILRHQEHVLLWFLGIGAALGLLIQVIYKLWERSGAWPRKKSQPSTDTPLSLPPSPWPLRRRIVASAAVALGFHLFLLGRSIGQRPALYAETLYDRGGLWRWVMLSLTHGRGQWLLATLAAIAGLFLTLGPLLSPRGRLALRRLWDERRWLVGAAVALALGGGVWALWPRSSPQAGRQQAGGGAAAPSLLLIAVDSLRADRVFEPERGRRVVPAIWQLAERSVRFEAAHVTVPRTFPSVVTLMTGRYPYRHGIRTMFPSLSEREQVPPALPSLLRERGYRTAVVSDFCGEIFSRIDLGFDRVQVPAFDAKTIVLQRSLTVHKSFLPYLTGALGGAAGLQAGERLFPELQSLAELADPQLLAARALAELRAQVARRPGAPFFMTVFFSTGHFPYAAPAPYYRRFADPGYRGPFRYHKPPLLEGSTPADIAQVRALYDGAMAANDAGVAALLGGLRELGLDKSTIVVLLADHGENLYDEPGRGMGHGDHLEGDHSLRVPLLVYDPVHRFAPHAVPGLVRDIDVLPTLLGLLGAAAPAGELDGVSLLPLLRGEKSSLGLTAFAETELWFTPAGPGFLADQRLPYPDVTATTAIAADDDIAVADRYRELVTVAKHRALRTEQHKLIYRPTRDGPRYSLYDVQRDPRELHDLSAQQPQLLAKLQAELFRLLAKDPSVVIDGGFVLPR
jgi:arylsulfatase A-like enzyme